MAYVASDQQKTIFSLYTLGVLMLLKVYSGLLVMKGQFLLWRFSAQYISGAK